MSTGRPTKLTATVQQEVCKAIAMGMTFELAAQYAGISKTTFFRWMRQGEESEEGSPFRHFWHSVKKAESKGALNALATINRAATDGSWQAAAWLLERRHKYRREAPVEEMDTVELADEGTPEEVIAAIAELPEHMILAALNRRGAQN